MQVEVITSVGRKEPGEALQPPTRWSTRLSRTKKVDKPSKKRLFVIASSSDEESAPFPPDKKWKRFHHHLILLIMILIWNRHFLKPKGYLKVKILLPLKSSHILHT